MDRLTVCIDTGLPRPVDPNQLPTKVERKTDPRGDNYVVHWDEKIQFDDDAKIKRTIWVRASIYGKDGARDMAWRYFHQRFKDVLPPPTTAD